ncbi:hypothetical protein MRB53_038733 [Persea americana]|nr:hypothetical protein MRB53_038733 [Persea americana]
MLPRASSCCTELSYPRTHLQLGIVGKGRRSNRDHKVSDLCSDRSSETPYSIDPGFLVETATHFHRNITISESLRRTDAAILSMNGASYPRIFDISDLLGRVDAVIEPTRIGKPGFLVGMKPLLRTDRDTVTLGTGRSSDRDNKMCDQCPDRSSQDCFLKSAWDMKLLVRHDQHIRIETGRSSDRDHEMSHFISKARQSGMLSD